MAVIIIKRQYITRTKADNLIKLRLNPMLNALTFKITDNTNADRVQKDSKITNLLRKT